MFLRAEIFSLIIIGIQTDKQKITNSHASIIKISFLFFLKEMGKVRELKPPPVNV
uniref:Uncharacterized protein n=1 Tax=Myoviridae sp. ctsip2 TaxID=2826705 RepID=A0A8S5N6E5_9CAUD|nr:MAG TPA: hypothetical protein [Myoviridae sp. ctsip2]